MEKRPLSRFLCSVLKRRPFCLILFPLILGIGMGEILARNDVPGPPWLLGIVVLAFILLIPLVARSITVILSIALLSFIFGAFHTGILHSMRKGQPLFGVAGEPVSCEITAIALQPEERLRRGRRVPVRTLSLRREGRTYFLSGNALLYFQNADHSIARGDTLTSRGILVAPDGERNPGEFDYRRYLYRKGIVALFYAGQKDTVRVRRIRSPGWYRIMLDVPRLRASALFDRYLTDARVTALTKALILGLRGELDPEIREGFAAVGIVHLLAVSGLHVGFVAAFVLILCRAFGLKRDAAQNVLFVVLPFYAGVTGFKPPVVRATLMALLYLLGKRLQREVDRFNILAAAATILLLFRPFDLFDAGFQLSFLAVFSIAYFYPKMRRSWTVPMRWQTKTGLRPLRWAWELLLVSVAAQLGTLVPVALHFERIPLAAVFSNLVFVPLVQMWVICGFVLLLVGAFSGWAAGWVSAAVMGFGEATLSLVERLASSGWIQLQVPGYPLWFWLLAGGAVWLFVEAWMARKRGWMAVALLLFLNGLVWQRVATDRHLKIAFLDVGQGDATVFLREGGNAVLVDAGPRSSRFDAGARTVVPYLKRRHIRQIEAIFLTHPHADHAGGVSAILTHFPVKRIYVTQETVWDSLCNIYPLCDSMGVEIDTLSAGAAGVLLENLAYQVFSPFSFMFSDSTLDENSRSLVLKFTGEGWSVLLCGDADVRTESSLLPLDTLLQSTVLKAGHHGSITSSSVPFLRKVRPAVAVLSVGKWNRFGHPHPVVIKRLEDLGAEVLRTDRLGALVFRAEGDSLIRIR